MKKIIAIDWNSTLADNIGLICQCTGLHRSQFSQWDPDLWTPELGQRMRMGKEQFNTWMWTNPMLQSMAAPYPGAARAIAHLAKYARIWIVTSTACPTLVAPWLRRNKVPYERIILSSDKGSVEWDWLVDDSPITLKALADSRNVLRHIVKWNEHLTDIRGVSWQ